MPDRQGRAGWWGSSAREGAATCRVDRGPTPWGRAFDDQDAELAAAALPPPDPPEDDPDDDPEEDDEPEDDPDEEEDPEEEDEDEELSPEDDSDFAGLVAVPPAVVSEPDARESVR
ncbi:hypothetical protein ACIBD9_08250 [Micromonospora sp. NPDC050784]|uniref:hypothetical protein n=1 Tax=Micromonospora sp. NPDC050784 TaxID=3364281 RepID=UPI00378B5D4B